MDVAATLGIQVDATGAVTGLKGFTNATNEAASATTRQQSVLRDLASINRQTQLQNAENRAALGGLSKAQREQSRAIIESMGGMQAYNQILKEIKASEQGATTEAQKLTASSKQVGQSMSQAGNHLKNFLSLAGIGLGVRELIQYSDTWQLVESRLRLVTTSTANLKQVQSDLFRVSQETRTGYEATATLYTRVARNAAQLGKSQQDLLSFTETVQKAMKVSGASSPEASAGVIQLSQALASGVLRGDEFRSVMENMPGLARAMADGLGISIGKLREMANEGKLTAATVIDSVLKMKGSIDKDFASVPVTIGDAFTQLQNAVARFIGSSADIQGASKGIVGVIQGIADGIEEYGRKLERFGLQLDKHALRLSNFGLAANAARTGNFGALGAIAVQNAELDQIEKRIAELDRQSKGIPKVGFLGELDPLNGGGTGTVTPPPDTIDKATKAFQAQAQAMQLDIDKANALNAAFGQSALVLAKLEIEYERRIANVKAASQYEGAQVGTIQALNNAMAQAKLRALELADAEKILADRTRTRVEMQERAAGNRQTLNQNLRGAFGGSGFTRKEDAVRAENDAQASADFKNANQEAAKQVSAFGRAAQIAGQALEYALVQKLGGGSIAGNIGAAAGKGVFSDVAGKFGANTFINSGIGQALLGPVAAGLGAAVGGVIDKLDLFGRHAREVAEAMKQLRIQTEAAALSARTAAQGFETEEQAKRRAELERDKRIAEANKLPAPFKDLEKVAALSDFLATIDRITKQFAEQRRSADADLEVRKQRALGNDKEADRLSLINRQQKELYDAQAQGMSDEYIARLKEVQALERSKAAHDDAAKAVLNLVQGYKYQATIFKNAPSSTGSPSPYGWEGGSSFTPKPIPVSAEPSGDLVVPLYLDGQQVGSAVLKNFQKRSQRKFGTTQRWSEIQS